MDCEFKDGVVIFVRSTLKARAITYLLMQLTIHSFQLFTETEETQQEDCIPMETVDDATPGGSSTSSTPRGNSGTSPFPEFSIRQITDNGFSREQAVEELRNSGGNVDEALASLLAKFFQSS